MVPVNDNQEAMGLTIRERAQKVAHHLRDSGLSLRELAAAAGISLSAVYRHQRAIARRNRYPESSWWETPEGSAWLKRLVLEPIPTDARDSSNPTQRHPLF